MRHFVIGSVNLETRRFSTDNLSIPRRDELTVRPSPTAKAASLSVPLDARKPSGRVSPPRSPIHDSQVEKLPYMRISSKTDVPPLTGLAEQSTLVDPLTLHDNPDPPKQDHTLDPFPLLPTTATTAPQYQDCPRIDLVALVREKQKAKRLQEKQLTVSKEPRRRRIPQGPNPKKSR